MDVEESCSCPVNAKARSNADVMLDNRGIEAEDVKPLSIPLRTSEEELTCPVDVNKRSLLITPKPETVETPTELKKLSVPFDVRPDNVNILTEVNRRSTPCTIMLLRLTV
jgi:hypothetical protein